MRHFSITTDIAAPAERVWQVMTDIDRWHEWTPSIRNIKRLGGVPFALGTRVVIRQPKFPPALWKVTAIERGRSFTWVSWAPGLRVVGRHSVEPTVGGSRATLTLDLHGIFGGIFGSLTRDITRRYIGFEAQGLKARSEDPSFRHGENAR
jgi:uncharacterized protein YndB with AHSA1/START domain